MNVIKKWYDRLPSRWQQYIEQHNLFDLKHFNSLAVLDFEDGSKALFKFAHVIRLDDELGVFTEHSGYYIFDIAGLKYSVQDMNVHSVNI